MTATVFYDSASEIAFISSTFLNLAMVPADPTTVSIVITDPTGNQVIHTYQGASPADVARVATGVYTLSLACQPSVPGIEGLWSYEWIGTGAVSDVQPGTWRVFSPGLGNWYCGLEELKDRLGINDTSDDFAAQQAIQDATTEVNEHCGQHFYRLTETRTFVPHSIVWLDIDPCVSVTALNVDTTGDGIFDQHWTENVDYQLFLGRDRYNLNALGIQRPYKKIQVLADVPGSGGNWFPYVYPFSRMDRVQIIGTWGWPSVPPPVAQATLMLAIQRFREKDAPFGVAGSSESGGAVHVLTANPQLMRMLRPFTNPKNTVGV